MRVSALSLLPLDQLLINITLLHISGKTIIFLSAEKKTFLYSFTQFHFHSLSFSLLLF